MSVPLDSDGFLRRECPACEEQFKWRASASDDEVGHVEQYFCPLCGRAAGVDAWWTQEQLEHGRVLIVPDALRVVQDALGQSFNRSRVLNLKPVDDLSDLPVPNALAEPDNMVIVEPPCHPAEPLKVPDKAPSPYYCLVCGSPFAT